MKVLKGILIGILDIVLFVVIFLFVMSFPLGMTKDVLKQEIIAEMDDGLVVEGIEGIVNETTKNFMVDNYDEILNSIIYGETTSFDAYEELIQYIKDNEELLEKKLGEDILVEDIEQIVPEDLKAQLNQFYKGTLDEFSDEELMAIRLYWFMASNEFKIILGFVAGVLLLLIALLQWSFYKWIRVLSSTSIINGVLSLAIGFVFEKAAFEDIFDNLVFGNNPFYTSGVVAIIVGVVLFVIYKIIKHIVNRKHDEFDERNDSSVQQV